MSAFSDLFNKEIERDLKWRESELAIMRKQLLQTTTGSTQEQTLLRANVAFLYAHYEGFCKFAIGVYLDALSKRKLKRKELSWNIAAHSLRRFFSELKQLDRQDLFFARVMNEFNAKLEEVAELENIAETSNLWPDLLVSWLDRLGLRSENIKKHSHFLHELVDSRNKIAHGQRLSISTRQAFDDYAQAAILAMHEVAIEIAYSLENRSYQCAGSVFTVLNHATPLPIKSL